MARADKQEEEKKNDQEKKGQVVPQGVDWKLFWFSGKEPVLKVGTVGSKVNQFINEEVEVEGEEKWFAKNAVAGSENKGRN